MKDCIFCKIVCGDASAWKVFETDATVAFFDINPVNEYHTLVIPKSHHTNVFDTPRDVFLEVTSTVKRVLELYHSKLGIENVQVLSNSGKAAQQDVFHLHFHIIPRFPGDKKGVRWNTEPELRGKFDQLLARLKD